MASLGVSEMTDFKTNAEGQKGFNAKAGSKKIMAWRTEIAVLTGLIFLSYSFVGFAEVNNVWYSLLSKVDCASTCVVSCFDAHSISQQPCIPLQYHNKLYTIFPHHASHALCIRIQCAGLVLVRRLAPFHHHHRYHGLLQGALPGLICLIFNRLFGQCRNVADHRITSRSLLADPCRTS